MRTVGIIVDGIKLIQDDWIVVWRNRNRTTQKYNIYKISFKGKQLIQRIYRIMPRS